MIPFSLNQNTTTKNQYFPSLTGRERSSLKRMPGLHLITPANNTFSYPCTGCDREKTHNCKENRGCQAFMLWKLMAVLE